MTFQFALSQTYHIISPQEINNQHKSIFHGTRLALKSWYMATGESFESLNYQYRIYLNAVRHIIKECCSKDMTSSDLKSA